MSWWLGGCGKCKFRKNKKLKAPKFSLPHHFCILLDFYFIFNEFFKVFFTGCNRDENL
jgi:hypothetical protein